MATSASTMITRNNRRGSRVALSGTVKYSYNAGESGTATCCDVSGGGMRVVLGRYLRPGRRLMVQVPHGSNKRRHAELKAEIAWCSPTEEPHEFLAGLRVLHDAPEAAQTLTALAVGGSSPLKTRQPRTKRIALPLIVTAWVKPGENGVHNDPETSEEWKDFHVAVCVELAKAMVVVAASAMMVLPSA
jgi:PilZ domain-containing protein